jgi:branched-chain amino acid transport system ATP-binding protein
VAALSEVTLAVPARGIQAVIGPNGAGKTTLLNALSGFYVPDSGGIRLREVPVAGRPPYAIARLGVARTFQTAQVFGDLSVAENVAVGVAGPRLGSVVAALVGAPWTRAAEARLRRRALALLAEAGLTEWVERPADAAGGPAPSPGNRARWPGGRGCSCWTSRPRVSLARSPSWTPTWPACETRAGRGRPGGTPHGPGHGGVGHITVLDYGRVIASGTPETVRTNPAVIEAYLGASE